MRLHVRRTQPAILHGRHGANNVNDRNFGAAPIKGRFIYGRRIEVITKVKLPVLVVKPCPGNEGIVEAVSETKLEGKFPGGRLVEVD